MNEIEKNLSIASQTAAKIAGHVIQSDTAIAAVRNGVMAEVHETILCAILDAANMTPAQAPAALASVTEHPATSGNDAAIAAVLEAIPGASVEAPPIEPPASQPTQISATSPLAELFQDALIHNPDKWWNNTTEERASINGGRSPDFKHKDLKDKKGTNPLAIWMTSEYSPTAPDWAWDKVGRLDDYKELVAQGKVKS
jgi:hypothetical protein